MLPSTKREFIVFVILEKVNLFFSKIANIVIFTKKHPRHLAEVHMGE